MKTGIKLFNPDCKELRDVIKNCIASAFFILRGSECWTKARVHLNLHFILYPVIIYFYTLEFQICFKIIIIFFSVYKKVKKKDIQLFLTRIRMKIYMKEK